MGDLYKFGGSFENAQKVTFGPNTFKKRVLASVRNFCLWTYKIGGTHNPFISIKTAMKNGNSLYSSFYFVALLSHVPTQVAALIYSEV